MKILSKILPYLEKVSLALLLAGGLFDLLDIDGGIMFIALALTTLSCVYFLQAYVPSDIKIAEGEQLGFQELLVLQILPRVLGISLAVATVGIQFFLLKLEGYSTMIGIGGSTIGIASFLALALKFSGARYSETLVPILFRAFTVLAVVAVLFLYGGLELP